MCEIDPYCQRVLAKHWPEVPCYGDIRTVDWGSVERVDVLAGGFPCQDISAAGTHAGIDGERSGLWREYARCIRALRPRFVVVENSARLLVHGMGTVLADLAACGYDAEWDCIPAAALSAPHLRDRLFIVAYANTINGAQGVGNLIDWKAAVQQARHRGGDELWLQAPPGIDRVDDGVSAGVYRVAVEALGNAVVPQCAEVIARAILAAEGLVMA